MTMTDSVSIEDWEALMAMLKWTGGDLNPRPPECKSGIHTRLNYQPGYFLGREIALRDKELSELKHFSYATYSNM